MGRRDARMAVRTNAETPADARAARKFGAEGIGLCRTEHMFFDGDRITAMREMILADSEGRAPQGARQAAADAARTSRAVRDHGRPAGDDPPARSAAARVPAASTDEEIAEVADHGVSVEKLAQRVDELHEFNPMLGHRGCRLAISYPEVAEMQARAIFEAAIEAAKSTGAPVVPEVMVPLVVAFKAENSISSRPDRCRRPRGHRRGRERRRHPYLVGTMIELPRAAICGPARLPKWPSSSPSAPTT
jgi:pyruvate,orthophosphate dikinase